MSDAEADNEKYPWVGPAIFITVLVAIILFFTWLI